MLTILKLLPKNLLSRIFGRLTCLPLPKFAREPLYRAYSRLYGVNLAEVPPPLSGYTSLHDFFTRSHLPGSRALAIGEKMVVSPVDGTLSQHGPIDGESLFQAKGLHYPLNELLPVQQASRYHNGYFVTLYLSPKDYHHVHAPLDMETTGISYIPGQLWPVNGPAVGRIPRLFARNERLVVYAKPHGLSKPIAVVLVGAFNVGRMSLTFHSLKTNPWWRRGIPWQKHKTYLHKGKRLGTFHLGSTVILLFPPQSFQPLEGLELGQIQLGNALGQVQTDSLEP